MRLLIILLMIIAIPGFSITEDEIVTELMQILQDYELQTTKLQNDLKESESQIKILETDLQVLKEQTTDLEISLSEYKKKESTKILILEVGLIITTTIIITDIFIKKI